MKKVPGNDILALRREIAAIDACILEGVSKRMDCARQLAALKRARQLPMRVPVVEKKVLARNLHLGTELGLSPELVTELTTLLISHALLAQERGSHL